jgi:hypothetical protein
MMKDPGGPRRRSGAVAIGLLLLLQLASGRKFGAIGSGDLLKAEVCVKLRPDSPFHSISRGRVFV